MTIDPTQMKLEDILEIVCEYYGLNQQLIIGRGRTMYIARARHMFCWLARRHTRRSFEEIAYFLRRDHTTAIHSYRVIENQLCIRTSSDADEARQLDLICVNRRSTKTQTAVVSQNRQEVIHQHRQDGVGRKDTTAHNRPDTFTPNEYEQMRQRYAATVSERLRLGRWIS